jgi:hypothetical protein
MAATTRTTSTTGIGVRGGTAALGGLSVQPIPLVLPAAFPVTRPATPIAPAIAPPTIAADLIAGSTPQLRIPASSLGAGTMTAAISAILPAALNQVQFRPTSLIPPIRIISPILTRQRTPNQETLSLSQLTVRNNQFSPADPHGINKLRPELISVLDFEPIYSGDTLVLNDMGVLMDVQYQSRHLREQTFFQLMQGIQQSDQAQRLQNIQNSFTTNFRKVNDSADFYKNTIVAIETVKNGFDVKSIPSNNFDLFNFRTLRDFYETYMLFPRNVFDRFSGTKIVMQLLFDMRAIAEGYSMNLLHLTDPDRSAGGSAANSPVSIDKTYNVSSGLAFTYDTIRSFTQAVNASENQFFTRFNRTLPQAPDDRIKLLVNMVSKELRVSRGLGRTTVTNNLRQKFLATTTDGSPFDNLIGGVGTTIFEPVTGPNSVASLTLVNDNENSAVLPFETKYIDVNNSHKVYVPGSTFFVDSIINSATLTSFNINPLRGYVEKYVDTVDSVATLIANIFDYGEQPSALSPVGILKQLLSGISHGLTRLLANPQRAGETLSAAEAATAAVFRLAATDPTLKSMLFQFVILNFFHSANSTFFINAIADELGNDISNLDAVTIDTSHGLPNLRSRNELLSYVTALGISIQNRVSILVNQQAISQNNNSPQNRSRGADPATGRMIVGFDVDSTYGIPSALGQSNILTDFNSVIVGIETIFGNEINNFFDSSKRTRFNALSMSTLMLMLFEAYSNLIIRYVKSDFQTSDFGPNFPDMVVDTTFNAQMYDAMQGVIADPELPIPLLPPETNTSARPVLTTSTAVTQRIQNSTATSAVRHVYDQVAPVAAATGNSTSDVHAGIAANSAVVGGAHATAGSRFTDATALALSGITQRINTQDLIDSQSIQQSISSIAFNLFQEDFSVACAMHCLLVIKQRLRTALDLANNYFTDQTLRGFAALNGTSLTDIGQNLTPTQVRVLLRQRDSYVRQLTNNTNQIQFIPASPTDVDTRSVILSLLGRGTFRETNDAGFRYRLMTVGIPSGFSKNLAERINSNNINSTAFQRNKAYEVVTVNVYKRSLEYPQVIFKPKKFIFDLALFCNGYSNLHIRPSENFDSVIQRITLLDYQNFTHPTTVDINNVVNSDKYSFIADPTVRRAMVENHIVSDILTGYIQALTTMKLDETTFVNRASTTWNNLSLGSQGTDLTPQFEELARKYLIAKRTADIRRNPALRPLPDIPIPSMLTSPLVDQSTKDTLKLLTFGNVAFKVENALADLLSPKLFERVFTIPVNVDDFEIDYAATTGPESGREFFQKEFFQRLLDPGAPRGTYRFKPRTHKDTVFEDYFVTIELVQ